MDTVKRAYTLDISRRRAFLGAAQAAAAGVIVGVGLIGGSAAAATSKLDQKVASYQTTPKGKQRCDNCVQWQPPGDCKIVKGPISPAGWCSLYGAK